MCRYSIALEVEGRTMKLTSSMTLLLGASLVMAATPGYADEARK
jgi:hypothetical protein